MDTKSLSKIRLIGLMHVPSAANTSNNPMGASVNTYSRCAVGGAATAGEGDHQSHVACNVEWGNWQTTEAARLLI